MFQVVKRDGELDEFKMGKITAAIDKAFDAKGKNYSSDMIDLLGLRVTADFRIRSRTTGFLLRISRTVWRTY